MCNGQPIVRASRARPLMTLLGAHGDRPRQQGIQTHLIMFCHTSNLGEDSTNWESNPDDYFSVLCHPYHRLSTVNRATEGLLTPEL